MPPRTSARTSATPDQASSPPPRQPNNRQSRSPVGRRTRARSQSAELGDNTTTTTRTGGRRARQGSADSVDSNTSAASSTTGRTRKATRRGVKARNLSIVAEDRETERPEDEEDAITEELTTEAEQAHSPGGRSEMSGTTAISLGTTWSAGEIAALDSLIAEYLPELFTSSCKILDLLAPADGTKATGSDTESIVRELKVLGSRRARRLKHDEDKFKITKDIYGGEIYIKPKYILRKLLHTDDPGDENFRPDSILHAANLAILIKEFLVIQRESPSTNEILWSLDKLFPEVFVGKFGSKAQFGQSALLEESFDLGLEIRTQFTIIQLEMQKDKEDWDPEKVLTANFYEHPSALDDAITNERLLNILGASPNSDNQIAKITARVKSISNNFRESFDAIEAGDLVDFELLVTEFPWLKFLEDLVHWTRLRLNEIYRDINEQGGIENITKSLIDIVKSLDSQADLRYESPPSASQPRQLLPPPPDLDRNHSSLYSGKADARHLARLKLGASSLDAPSSDPQRASSSLPKPPSSQQQRPPSNAKLASSSAVKPAAQPSDDFVLQIDDGGDEIVEEPHPRPSAQYVERWQAHDNEKNKENLPSNSDSRKAIGKAKSLLARQPGAEKYVWSPDSQDSVAGPLTMKRSRQARADSEETEDQGYQEDRRLPDPNRRGNAPLARPRTPIEEGEGEGEEDEAPPQKRAKLHQSDNRPAARTGMVRRDHESPEVAPQASARRGPVDEEESSGEDRPPPFSQISIAARNSAARARLPTHKTQKRTLWSEYDTELLTSGIETHGCSWSTLSKLLEFEVERDQVALKDKARNLKVSYLKAGITPLPLNFEHIALGKKEIAQVRAVRPDYEPFD